MTSNQNRPLSDVTVLNGEIFYIRHCGTKELKFYSFSSTFNRENLKNFQNYICPIDAKMKKMLSKIKVDIKDILSDEFQTYL